MREIGKGIDAGDDQIGLEVDGAEQGQRHAIAGRAAAGVGFAAIGELDFAQAQRLVQRFDVPARAPVLIRRDDGHRADFFQRLLQDQ